MNNNNTPAVVVQNAPTTQTGGDIALIDRKRFAVIKEQVSAMNDFVQSVMEEGKNGEGDYGFIPGVKKKVLFKQGAEKICQLLNVAPDFIPQTIDLGDGHREVTVRCQLISRVNGNVVGGGIGSCSTLEKKYRWRNIYKNGEMAGKEENPDIAETYNTVLKMAKKRALVDACITLGVCSGMFTQDVDDNPEAYRKGGDSQPQRAQSQAPRSEGMGRYRANIPYKEGKLIKDKLSAHKWRWHGDSKTWHGNELFDEVKQYLITEQSGEVLGDDNIGSGDGTITM